MSNWTYIKGTIEVVPLGRYQPEKRYILDTVLSHLPKVTGSEKDMDIYTLQKNGYSGYCSHDEFGQDSNLSKNRTQDNYIIVIQSSLRDREFNQTFKEFMNWLCRFSKRIIVIFL